MGNGGKVVVFIVPERAMALLRGFPFFLADVAKLVLADARDMVAALLQRHKGCTLLALLPALERGKFRQLCIGNILARTVVRQRLAVDAEVAAA